MMMDVGNGYGHFLDRALTSLTRQTFPDFEIVLVDNGSTDDTADRIADWQRREPRLRAERAPRAALARVHNQVAAMARAPLLARLDADDIAMPDRLAKQVAALAANPRLGLVGSAAEVIDVAGKRLATLGVETTDSAIRRVMPYSCPFVHSSIMLRRDAFEAAGGYRPGLNLCEDYDLYARMLERWEGANLSDALIQYRIHAGSVTGRRFARMAVTSVCIGAAQIARARGEPEPFINGVPNLRRAEAIVAREQPNLRRTVKVNAWRTLINRALFTAPVPVMLKSGLRDVALKLRMRAVYVALLRTAALFANKVGR